MLTFLITDPTDQVLNQVKELIQDNNGTFRGDSAMGYLEIPLPIGSVKGNYIVDDNKLRLTIKEKPFLVTERAIRSVIVERIDGLV
jgi:hypothetical protein